MDEYLVLLSSCLSFSRVYPFFVLSLPHSIPSPSFFSHSLSFPFIHSLPSLGGLDVCVRWGGGAMTGPPHTQEVPGTARQSK